MSGHIGQDGDDDYCHCPHCDARRNTTGGGAGGAIMTTIHGFNDIPEGDCMSYAESFGVLSRVTGMPICGLCGGCSNGGECSCPLAVAVRDEKDRHHRELHRMGNAPLVTHPDAAEADAIDRATPGHWKFRLAMEEAMVPA